MHHAQRQESLNDLKKNPQSSRSDKTCCSAGFILHRAFHRAFHRDFNRKICAQSEVWLHRECFSRDEE
jgi:hypothetical protein